MGGITGFCAFNGQYLSQKESYGYLSERMGGAIAHRGSLQETYTGACVCFAIRKDYEGMHTDAHEGYLIAADCEIYNADELRQLLTSKGFSFKTNDPSEIILGCYLQYGHKCASVINGVFSFAIWDDTKKTLFLCRDRLGVKPLFYTFSNGSLIFASEMKALFEFPGVNAKLDSDGLCELFGLLPSRTEGCGVFKDINEIKYGHFGLYTDAGFAQRRYWNLVSMENDFSYDEAVERVHSLVSDAVARQLPDEKPVCAFLSGGLDSSIVTALAAEELSKEGKTLDTFSLDYEENDKYFQVNSFQGDTDPKWANKLSRHYKTNHNLIVCSVDDLVNCLYPSVVARDLPGMADIDASMLYFCNQVSKSHGVALTGECADELFGGYPWFHDPTALKTAGFPWIRQTDTRKLLLSPDVIAQTDIDGYVKMRYQETIADTPALDSDSAEEKRRREIAYLNIKWFMTNLIDRTERCGMYSSFAGRMPFADYRLAELLWNLPWPIKCGGCGVPKSLLREAFANTLPNEFLNRKKSPFPKTYHPEYERTVKDMLLQIINDPSSPILPLISKQALEDLITLPADYGKPWYGQLMATPQLLAFFMQVDYWLRRYSVSIV